MRVAMCPRMTTASKVERPHSVRLRVSDEELDWLRSEAERQDRTIAAILRKALREYLEARA